MSSTGRRRLIALVNAYNEEAAIENALRSVAGHVDEIHVFDGAYAQYPHRNPSSTDNTRQIVKRFGAVWHPTPEGVAWPDQLAKRTAMFAAVPDGDLAFILDADEVVANPAALAMARTADFDVGWGETFSNLYAGPYRTPRLLLKCPGLHYAGRHSWIYDGRNRLVASHQHMTTAYRHADLPLRVWNLRQAGREGAKARFRGVRNPLEALEGELATYGGRDVLVPHPDRAGTPRKGIEIIKPPQDPWGTLVIPFSRPWALDRWADAFREVDLPWERVEIIAVADTDDRQFAGRIREVLAEFSHGANGARLYVTGNPKLPEGSRSGHRRARILGAWHVFLTEALGEILLGAEDDTLPAPDAYLRLLTSAEKHGAVFAQGTEIGRWNSPFVPHWRIVEQGGKIVRIEAGRKEGGNGSVQQIDGGGWYCFVCRTDAARQVEMGWTKDPPLGPDVWFVKRLRDAGYMCIGDWDVECAHFGQGFSLHPSTTETCVVTWLPERGGWRMAVEWPNRKGAALVGAARASRRREGGPGNVAETTTKGDVDEMSRLGRSRRRIGGETPDTLKAMMEPAVVKIKAIRTFAGDEGFLTKGAERWTTRARARQLVSHGYAVILEDKSEMEAAAAAEVEVDPVLGIPVEDAAAARVSTREEVVAAQAPSPVLVSMMEAQRPAAAPPPPNVPVPTPEIPAFGQTPRHEHPFPNVEPAPEFTDELMIAEIQSAPVQLPGDDDPAPVPIPRPEDIRKPGEILDARMRDSKGVPLRNDSEASGSKEKHLYPCKKCGKGYNKKTSLISHMHREHPGGK